MKTALKFYKLTSLLLLILFQLTLKAQFYTISGTVRNSSMEPIPLAEVSVQNNGVLNTKTDYKGQYSIKISEGTYELVFTLQGYKTLKMPVTVNSVDVVVNCILEPSEKDIKGFKVSAKKVDRSEEIIQYVIDGKSRFMNPAAFTVDAYIKAGETETRKKQKNDTNQAKSQQLNVAEVYLTYHYSPPNKIKEERKGVDIRGQKEGLFFLSHTDGQFNFYKNLLEVPALSESPILSPICNSGLIAYKYKMIKIFVENGIKYYKIKVIPGLMGNALVSGELTIQDSVWAIKSLKLSLPKYHMAEYDFFEVSQTYELTDSAYVLQKMEFVYQAKYGKTKTSGRTAVYYSQYHLNKTFPKKFFNNELSATAQEAYERDTLYWAQIRKEPLSKEELNYIRRSDSVRAVFAQKTWQDSSDSVFNRITFKKLMFTGQGFYKRSAERNIQFKPLIFLYTPFYLAGPRFNYWVSFSKTYKNKKYFSILPALNFGQLNKDLKGSLNLSRLYNPFSRGSYNLNIGSDFSVINPYNSWIKGLSRSNFYAHDFANFYHRVELFNGFYVGMGGEYSNRRSISNLKFDAQGDSLWGGNVQTTAFTPYKALYASFALYYVPFQKYIREPYQKLILGSQWPEISARYRKGINELGSVINFDYLEFVAEQELKIGLLGVSKYRVVSGGFLNSKDLRLIDYKYQRAIGPVFFANPLYSFQSIDTSFSTLKRFYEGHYLHRFNGALINKIPVLKKVNISECIGGGFLFTKERNLKFLEAYVGIEKIIRLWRERIRIGVFYVANINNQFSVAPQFKFTIEVYDKVGNRWPY